MTTYIALTALESHWGNPKNTLLLTDGCRLYDGGNAWEKYGEPVDTERFHATQDFDAAYSLCNDLSARAMPQLASLLENYYNIGYGMRFYERIIWPWLAQFTQALYDRYMSIQRAAALGSDVYFLTADTRVAPYPCKDSLTSIVAWSRCDQYNLLLYSDIASFLGLLQKKKATAPLVSDFPVFGSKGTSSRKEQVFSLAASTVQKIYTRLSRRPQHFLSGCYGAYINYFHILSRAKMRWQSINTHVSLKHFILNTALRKQKLALGGTTFENLLEVFIPRYIPFGMCEALPELVAWAKGQRCNGEKGVLATSTGLYTDIPLMVLAGVSQRPLAILEHGGSLMLRTNFHHDIQCKVATKYYSQGTATTPYLPSPYLDDTCLARCVSAPLLVANDGYRYLPRLLPFFCEGSSQPYHEIRKSFLHALPQHLYPDIRLYPLEFGWGVRKGLEVAFTNLRFQDGSKIAIEQAIANSCLIVLDHYSTTFHRTMATNRPTILFSRADIFSTEAESVIEALRQCKIWHDTPESAAKNYQMLVGNPNSWAEAQLTINDWWNSSEVQSARKMFCDMYARTSDNWAQEWTAAFDRLAIECS